MGVVARRILRESLTVCLSLALGAVTPQARVLGPTDALDLRQDEVIDPPQPIHQERPKYTEAARKAGIQGEVVLRAVVEKDGSVGRVTVERSLDTEHGLDDAAIAAAKRWRFRPGRLKGEPVSVRVTIALTFTL